MKEPEYVYVRACPRLGNYAGMLPPATSFYAAIVEMDFAISWLRAARNAGQKLSKKQKRSAFVQAIKTVAMDAEFGQIRGNDDYRRSQSA